MHTLFGRQINVHCKNVENVISLKGRKKYSLTKQWEIPKDNKVTPGGNASVGRHK